MRYTNCISKRSVQRKNLKVITTIKETDKQKRYRAEMRGIFFIRLSFISFSVTENLNEYRKKANMREKWFLSFYGNDYKQDVIGLLVTEEEVKDFMAEKIRKLVARSI